MASNQNTRTPPGTGKSVNRKKLFMYCPACKGDSCGVHNVQHLPGKKIRWRVCDKCGCVFTTTESVTSICENLFGDKNAGREREDG
jgi:hypothetical protein